MKNMSFDVESRDDYNHFRKNFIHRMRTELNIAVHDARLPDGGEQRVARLPGQVPDHETPEFMDLTLRARDRSTVTLRLRTDNLYVIGFCNGTGHWFEFADRGRNTPMIQGSTSLGYQGNYQAGGIGDLSENEAILGRTSSLNAICGLARYGDGGRPNNDENIKYWLRTLIVNFIESVRLNSVANRVAIAMSFGGDTDGARRRLTVDNIRDIGHWGSLSEAFTIASGNADDPRAMNPFNRPYFCSRGIYDRFEAANVLGMVLAVARAVVVTRTLQGRHGRSLLSETTSSTAAPDAMGGSSSGIMLAEVIGVLICNINDCDPGKLYGTIKITDGSGTHQLFSRDKDNLQSVGPGGWADLASWPPRAISGADDFTIGVDLYDHNSLLFDKQVACGVVAWNSRDVVATDYNKIVKVEAKGQHGSVEVQYAVLTDAVVAVLEVVVGDDGETSLDVYGKVTATIRMACGEELKYELFNKDRGQQVGVPKRTAIPLQRNLVSVPLLSDSVLQVQAHLSDAMFRSHIPFCGDDKQIANGCASFTPPLIAGEPASAEEDINGTDGNVKVTVTWSI